MWRTARGGGPGGRSKMVRKFNFRKNLALEQLQLLHKATSNPLRLSPSTRLFSWPPSTPSEPLLPLRPPFITSPPFWRFCVNCCHMTGRQAKGCAKCKVDQGCPWAGVVKGGHGRCVASSRLIFLFGPFPLMIQFRGKCNLSRGCALGLGLGFLADCAVLYPHPPPVHHCHKWFVQSVCLWKFPSALFFRSCFPLHWIFTPHFSLFSSVSRFDTPYSTEWRACDIFRFNKVNLG